MPLGLAETQRMAFINIVLWDQEGERRQSQQPFLQIAAWSDSVFESPSWGPRSDDVPSLGSGSDVPVSRPSLPRDGAECCAAARRPPSFPEPELRPRLLAVATPSEPRTGAELWSQCISAGEGNPNHTRTTASLKCVFSQMMDKNLSPKTSCPITYLFF